MMIDSFGTMSWLQFRASDCRGLEKLNDALIVLLPKKVGASCTADFRPITMIHSFAKLISKILALSLAPKLNDMVDKNQNAFIRSRTNSGQLQVHTEGIGSHKEEKDSHAPTQA